ncbi:MAG: hypothetical protein K0S67_517 [Nitrososphaeraceae archaeon]|jgi:hypothetical protein|nr:hypothetical protein [Nitrososphaeraceae archaeon]MCD6036633.1 hypothetical protein [Nitrososphaeraceae archaeon]MDF2770125.1 hypothetical protein [Nitrososphaeraceae archaeon]
MTNKNQTAPNIKGNDLHQNMQTQIQIVVALIGLVGGLAVIFPKFYSDKKIEQLKQEHNLRLKDLEQRYKLESEYDLDLRIKRIEAYNQLWSHLTFQG